MAKKGEKILTQIRVKKLGLDKVSVITADMLEGYTSIGDWALWECSLTSISIPNSVKSIGDYAFYNCSGLASVTIPNSVTNIGYEAFAYCRSLTSVTIPNSVTSIGGGAFSRCSSLTSVTIPNSVTNIRDSVFNYCSSLTSISVATDNLNYSSKDGVLFNKQQTTLIQYPGGMQGEYVIPNSVTSIGSWAFDGCSSLTSVTIPNSVISIGGGAFYNCSGLTSVTIPNSVTSIGECAFNGCSSLTSVTISDKTYEKQTVNNGKCKAYKGFNADMTCRDFQYEECKTYELEEEPKLCECGFHACLNLTNVFNYYYGKIGKNIVIHEVELEGVINDKKSDSKVVAKKITIGKRIL